MRPNYASIKKYKDQSMHILNNELAFFYNNNSIVPIQNIYDKLYEIWYEKIYPIRSLIRNIIDKFGPLGCDNTVIFNKHRIDHHLYSYISPLLINRYGYNNVFYNSADHIIDLAKKFTEEGIRFIYAALPNKISLYPNIMFPKELYEDVPSIIPQYRRMIYYILKNNVEVIDIFPKLRQWDKIIKNGLYNFTTVNENFMDSDILSVFSLSHNINHIGCHIIGKIIAEYIKSTTCGIQDFSQNFYKEDVNIREDGVNFSTYKIMRNDDLCYDGNKNEVNNFFPNSEIGIFGNCNLQTHLGSGHDVTAYLSFALGYPVDYCGRILPFQPDKYTIEFKNFDTIRDGIFYGKKIVIYLGFPSACYVRSMNELGCWAKAYIPKRFFTNPDL